MENEKREREVVKELIEETIINIGKKRDVEIGSKAKKWLKEETEKFCYKQYVYSKEKNKIQEKYSMYIYKNLKKIKAIRIKINFLYDDLLRTKSNISNKVIRIGKDRRKEAAMDIYIVKDNIYFNEEIMNKNFWDLATEQEKVAIMQPLF